MLTNEDIQKIIEANRETFATKEDFYKLATLEEFDQFRNEVKQEFSSLREVVQALSLAIDKLVKAVEDLSQEYVMITLKVDRHEKWLHQVAEKLGIKLEY